MTIPLTLAAAVLTTVSLRAAELCVFPMDDAAAKLDACYCEGMEIKDAAVEAGRLVIWSASPTRAREWTVSRPPADVEHLAAQLRSNPNLQLCCGYDPRDPRECAKIATRVTPAWQTLPSSAGTIHADVGAPAGRLGRSL